MFTRKLAGAVAALALIGGAALVAAVPAMATGNGGCPTTTLTGTSGVTTSGDATATVTENGLRMRTPVRASRVRFEQPYSNAFANLTGLSYRTFTHSDGDRGFATVAARVGLDTNGDAKTDVTLVYEPYYNATLVEGEWQSWDTVAAGAGKWWWAEEPGNPQTPRPWSHWQDTHSDAVLTFVNVGMGTWNEGADARVDDLRVSVKGHGCKRFGWKKPDPSPSATGSATPSATPTRTAEPTPTATASPTATGEPTSEPTGTPSGSAEPEPTFSPSPAAGGGGGLPLTGAPVWVYALAGLAVLLIGTAAYLLARRRNEPTFTA
ncbi:LPXTG cell wall anchor domain-containing protein [Micromonospora sp. WMMD1102]|uniref:LPXTG cell wall anchor domain-containing protein n=1 Tax=Micromonospora sp. WMMD1102 TaxID=3016105 RepID=UPI0024156CE2|nr:LPXTG cell wall anchor domain-containing protein [Micromonospora sp. WMMD1102]MDG4791933.1 LPXTG cell wall anchor domain-containing protein [Micromonospora sp. WMMD1102]